MKAAITIAVVSLGLATTAAAQPSLTPAQPQYLPAPQYQGEPLSEGTATALSLGGTIASWALVIGASNMTEDRETADTLGLIGGLGTFFAPSFGHWYARSAFTRGMGLRAGGMLSAMTGAMVALTECPIFSEEECHQSGVGVALLIAGVGLYIGGTIDDIATADDKVRKYNKRFQNVGIAPVVTPHSAGFALGGRF